MASDVSVLQALVNHMVLPPRLPLGLDMPDARLAPEVTKLALASIQKLSSLTENALHAEYEHVCACLRSSLAL
jgi:hypothetical protein